MTSHFENTYLLSEIVEHFLAKDHWHFQYDREHNLFDLASNGENGSWVTRVVVYEQERDILIYSFLSVKVPANKRLAIAELLLRINNDLFLSSFQMDFETGEVVLKNAISMMDGFFTNDMFGKLFYANLYSFDEYLPTIMQAIYSPLRPQEILSQKAAQDIDVTQQEDIAPEKITGTNKPLLN